MPEKPTLYVMVGFPASGKSTYIENNLSHAINVCYDRIVEILTHKWSVYHVALYNQIEWLITHESLTRGYDTVVERTHLTPQSRARVLNASFTVETRKTRNVAIVLNTSVEECKARSANRAKVIDNDKALSLPLILPSISEGFDEIIHV